MKGDPVHHALGAAEGLARRQARAINQDHRNLLYQSRFQLGFGTCAPGILGDDIGDGIALQKRQIVGQRKGAACDDHGGIRQRQGRPGRIDQTQQIVVLRLGGKGRQRLLADGQKDPGGVVGQGGDRRICIGDVAPVVTRPGHPLRANQGTKRRAGCKTGVNGIAADLGGKGVRRVNDMGDAAGADIVRQPTRAAKTANAGGQRLGHRHCRAAGIGKDRIDTRARQFVRQRRGLGRATQKKDADHG